MVVVKAKLLRLFLAHPKTKMSSVPFVADWNIQEPFEKAQSIILCHLILQVFFVVVCPLCHKTCTSSQIGTDFWHVML